MNFYLGSLELEPPSNDAPTDDDTITKSDNKEENKEEIADNIDAAADLDENEHNKFKNEKLVVENEANDLIEYKNEEEEAAESSKCETDDGKEVKVITSDNKSKVDEEEIKLEEAVEPGPGNLDNHKDGAKLDKPSALKSKDAKEANINLDMDQDKNCIHGSDELIDLLKSGDDCILDTVEQSQNIESILNEVVEGNKNDAHKLDALGSGVAKETINELVLGEYKDDGAIDKAEEPENNENNSTKVIDFNKNNDKEDAASIDFDAQSTEPMIDTSSKEPKEGAEVVVDAKVLMENESE